MASLCCRNLLFRGSTVVHRSTRHLWSAASSSKSRYLEIDGMRLPFRKLKQSTDADLITLLDELVRPIRRKTGKAILEGRRLISDAIYAKVPLEAVLFTEMKHIQGLPLVPGDPALIHVHQTQLERWSSVKTAPGALAIIHVAEPDVLVDEASASNSMKIPFYAILDNVTDPTNLGSVVRVLAAAACGGILVTQGCCDAWCGAALRGGMGAHFRIPIKSHVDWNSIPSLLPPDSAVFLLESTAFDQIPLTGSVDESLVEERIVDGTELAQLSYNEPNYVAHSPVVLIIGGSVQQGLSVQARILAEEMGGLRLSIPIQPQSPVALHPVAAASIVAFEIRKQFLSDSRQAQ